MFDTGKLSVIRGASRALEAMPAPAWKAIRMLDPKARRIAGGLHRDVEKWLKKYDKRLRIQKYEPRDVETVKIAIFGPEFADAYTDGVGESASRATPHGPERGRRIFADLAATGGPAGDFRMAEGNGVPRRYGRPADHPHRRQ